MPSPTPILPSFLHTLTHSSCVSSSLPSSAALQVCTTELGRIAQLKKKFEDRKTKVLALSVDKVDNHGGWVKDINEIVGCTVDFPIVADPDRRISCLYGMLNQEVRNINTTPHCDGSNFSIVRSNLTSTLFLCSSSSPCSFQHLEDTGMPFTVRSVFIIGPDRRVKLTISYPASTGRNFDEILRVLDSLQLTVSHKVATPADWQKGGECVVLPTIPTDEAKKIFPKGVTEVRPWLRTTPDPSA